MKRFTSAEIRNFVSEPRFDEKTVLAQDTSWPKISVVTPSFNQGQFLERTILSVLNQNYPNLEYTIMDGGSTDDSVEIIKKYEKYLAHWVSEKDGGQADAIRKAFNCSAGEILAYLNSDDTYNPDALKEVACAFAKDPTADLVFGNTNFIDTNDDVAGECRFTKFHFSTLIYEGTCLHQPAAFWTRHAYDGVGGLNPCYRFCMDYDFFCRLGKNGRFRHIRETLANFRVHEAAKSSTISHVGRAEHEQIASNYRANSISGYIKCRKTFCQMRRLIHYVAQGDADYVVRGLRRRSRKRGPEGANCYG